MRKSQNKKQGKQGKQGWQGKQGKQGESVHSDSLSKQSPLTSLTYLVALASGMLMGLTVAPVDAWPLAWIALAPLWVLVVKSPKQEKHFLPHLPHLPLPPLPPYLPLPPHLPLSLLWGIGYHGLALWWITGIHPMTWMGVPWLASLAIAIFCWTFITLWGAALVAAWATCMAIFGRGAGILARVLIGTALWCGLEALWSAGPLWWTSLSYTQSPHNLAILHLGQLSGPSAVTATLVAVNGLIAESLLLNTGINIKTHSRKYTQETVEEFDSSASISVHLRFPNWRYLGIAAGLLVGLHLIGFGLYSRSLIQLPSSALKVGIIQGNVPNEIKLYPAGFRRAIENYTTGYKILASQGVDAVLTPEGALPFMWTDVSRSSFYSAILERGVVAWLGAFGKQESSYTNSLFTVTGNGDIFSRYNKVKLVPIGEYVPFEQFLGSLVKRLSPLDEHQVAGSPTQVFDTPFGRAIVVICYGSAFAEQFRYQAAAGGQFILSPSNDAHYSPAMPAQHHAQDVMRAIETDRWAVRATNTGYSAIVDPHGRTVWISRLHTYELHAATIYRQKTQTLYVRWGDWLTSLLLVLGALAWWLAKPDRSPTSDPIGQRGINGKTKTRTPLDSFKPTDRERGS